MQRALLLAARGRGSTSPNPLVGAVIVDPDGVVVGSGFHETAGGPHAEVVALDAAGARARGATLYCTLEPCCHVGRTGPCTSRIAAAGIARVVAALRDPNPLVAGGGFETLRRSGVQVLEGVCAEAAARLNAPFLRWVTSGRPYVIAKVAVSSDGKVAAAPGLRTAITSAAANRRIHRDRAEVDAIAVGTDTLLIDDPLLTPRGAWRRRPLVRAIFDRRLRTPPSARVFSTLPAGPVIIVSTAEAIAAHPGRARALERAGATVEVASNGDLEQALAQLGRRGITSLLVEGGPTLQRAFARARLVDAWQVYVAPTVLGGGGVPWLDVTELALTLPPSRVRILGADARVEIDVHRTR